MRIVFALVVFSFIAIFQVGMPVQSFAAERTNCLVSSLRESLSSQHTFWESTEPYMVNIDGKELPITLAFDSELPHRDVFKHVMQDPVAREELRSAAEKLKFAETSGRLNKLLGNDKWRGITLQQLASTLGLSEKQARIFAIRKDVEKNKALFDLTDLTPKSFDHVLSGILSELVDAAQRVPHFPQKLIATKDSGERFLTAYRKIALRFVEQNQLPMAGHFEEHLIELTHTSSETNPSRFYSLITKDLHARFPGAQTHLHAGIPAEVPRPQTTAIARAVETRVVLRLAADHADDSINLYNDGYNLGEENAYYSSLRKGTPASGKRVGVVRLNFSKWYTPVLAHDIEIRQWLKIDEGLDDVQLVATLAQKHDSLVVLEDFEAKVVPDLVTGNLNGALRYAGLLLQRSTTEQSRLIGEQLVQMANRIETEGTLTRKTREDVMKFLNRYLVVSLLDAEAFLK